MILLTNTKIITPFYEIPDGFLVIKDKLIHFVGITERDIEEFNYFKNNSNKVIDLKAKISAPGLIDIHTHGALGKDYSNSPDLLLEDAKFRVSKGVTSFVPTIGAMVPAEKIIESAIKLTKLIQKGVVGAKPLGINLEGPFLYPDYAGAAGPKYCSYEIDLQYLRRLQESIGKYLKIVTISPELKESIKAIIYLKEKGVILSIGHTNADYSILDKAIRSGVKLVTHLYNTSPIPEQNISGVFIPGVNEYLMMRDDVMAEVICDVKGIHIKPTVLKIILRCKGIDKTVLVTDSLITAGLPKNGKAFMPDGEEIYIKDGVNVQSSGQISGSAMTMDLSVKSIMIHTDVNLRDGLLMATFNPAKVLGIQKDKGSIEVGKDADIIVIDKDINVYMTIVEGKILFDCL